MVKMEIKKVDIVQCQKEGKNLTCKIYPIGSKKPSDHKFVDAIFFNGAVNGDLTSESKFSIFPQGNMTCYLESSRHEKSLRTINCFVKREKED